MLTGLTSVYDHKLQESSMLSTLFYIYSLIYNLPLIDKHFIASLFSNFKLQLLYPYSEILTLFLVSLQNKNHRKITFCDISPYLITSVTICFLLLFQIKEPYKVQLFHWCVSNLRSTQHPHFHHFFTSNLKSKTSLLISDATRV